MVLVTLYIICLFEEILFYHYISFLFLMRTVPRVWRWKNIGVRCWGVVRKKYTIVWEDSKLLLFLWQLVLGSGSIHLVRILLKKLMTSQNLLNTRWSLKTHTTTLSTAECRFLSISDVKLGNVVKNHWMGRKKFN